MPNMTLAWVTDEFIINALDSHIRVNTTLKTVEIYNDYGVQMVLRDLKDDVYEAFKTKFQNY